MKKILHYHRADKPAGTSPPLDSISDYQLSDIQKHPDVSSCWSAINGKVYDLTAWVNQHPGGQANLKNLRPRRLSGFFSQTRRKT